MTIAAGTTLGRYEIRSLIGVGGISNIWSQPIDGSAPRQLTNFKSDLIFAFDLSRDGKQIVLSRGNISNDVVLIADSK